MNLAVLKPALAFTLPFAATSVVTTLALKELTKKKPPKVTVTERVTLQYPGLDPIKVVAIRID